MPGFHQGEEDFFTCPYCGRNDFKKQRSMKVHKRHYCPKRPRKKPKVRKVKNSKKWME